MVYFIHSWYTVLYTEKKINNNKTKITYSGRVYRCAARKGVTI